MFTFKEIQAIEHAALNSAGMKSDTAIHRVVTDSRTTKPGDLFVAIRGEQFDGHQFVNAALERGAVGVIVDDKKKFMSLRRPVMVVNDTTKALGELARLHRRKFNIPVVAITGSSGKTTTKEMLRDILRMKYHVLSTEGNFNNHIGVPQTLFRLTAKHEIAVIEMGMNHAGEISYLCGVAEPTHGVITNVGKAHLEHFRTIKKIAKAKAELFDWLGSNKERVGYVNVDDALIALHAKKLKTRMTYSETSRRANAYGKLENVDSKGLPHFLLALKGRRESIEIGLNVAGVHNVSNALAAAVIGNAFGVAPQKLKKALHDFKSIGGRMEVNEFAGITIINDAYNANPDSMLSALKTIASMDCKGKRIAVLGDMLELGTGSVSEHRRIGSALRKLRCDILVTYGRDAKFIHDASTVHEKLHFNDKSLLIEQVMQLLNQGDIVLIKGSHGMKMDEIASSFAHVLSMKEGIKAR